MYLVFSNIGLYWLEQKKKIGYIQLFVGLLCFVFMVAKLEILNQDLITVLLVINNVLWIFGIIEIFSKIDILLFND